MANVQRKVDLKTAEIDGKVVYIIDDKDQAEALYHIIEDRIFMEEAKRRFRQYVWFGGSIVGALILLASWWPAINDIMQAIFRYLPK